uniref:Uncharacterized protein n=1 Tax=Anguilla anguilla TaxID=7936 RepID=A0A0E9QFM0_ANGAN
MTFCTGNHKGEQGKRMLSQQACVTKAKKTIRTNVAYSYNK